MTATAHTFDWHAEADQSFLGWAFLHFAGFSEIGREKFDRVSDLSNRFTNVELGITVNGVEMDAKAFIDAVDQAMNWAVEREAAKMIASSAQLHGLHEALQDLERGVKEHAIQLAAEAGIELTEGDWR